MKTCTLIYALSILLFAASAAAAQDVKENLDLPLTIPGLAGEDEELAPEVTIFFGQQYEGDGIFLCMDRSGSTANGELSIEKREIIRTVSEFSSRVQFGIVFVESSVVQFPRNGTPVAAEPGNKQAAIAFVNSVGAGRATCFNKGLRAVVDMANKSTASRNAIIFYSDGIIYCPGVSDAAAYAQETLAMVQQVNFRRIPIHSIVVGHEASEWFPKTLSEMNQGTYTRKGE